MEFKLFNAQIQKQFALMCESKKLFRANISRHELWEIYLKAFPSDPIFRNPESTQHNCNYCNNFIRRYGNIVSINKNGKIETLFSSIVDDEVYGAVSKKLDEAIKLTEINNVFFETYTSLRLLAYESCDTNQKTYRIGISHNHKRYTREEAELFGVVKANEIRTFHHFHLDLPKQFVDMSGKSTEAVTSIYRDKYNTFKRLMEEIPSDTLSLVIDLINQGSLLDGTSHLHSVKEVLKWKLLYNSTKFEKDIFCWNVSYEIEERTAKFKNSLVGALCTELAEGLELNKACENWNKRADPVNYHKVTAPITQRQIEEAKKFVEKNGYSDSFNRRLANIDDIKASEIKHINAGDGEIKEVSIFDNVKSTTSRHKRSKFDNIEEVSITKFMKDILPSCTLVEILLEQKQENNLVSLTTSINKESKPIFKWTDNNYSWTFNGNLAGKSQIKEAVRSKGGKVDGILRFSIMWAENDGDNSDLDARCKEPRGNLIYFSNRVNKITGGNLDIDITRPKSQMPKGAVENITFPKLNKMDDGVYKFIVDQYRADNSKGFKAEIEFNGETYFYEYNKPLRGKEKIQVAEVTLKNGEFTINHKLPESNNSKTLWNLETNQFHKVNLVCLTPNHWGDNQVGNLHYIFGIDGCKTSTATRGFHNEHLLPDILKHKKVMEVLGSTTLIEATDKQLSGLGFNSTVKDEIILRCKGSFNRMLKIKF